MNYYKFLIALFSLLPFWSVAQQLVWVHQPFSEKNIPNWRYSQDTVLFSSNSSIWGIVYLPTIPEEKPSITIQIDNSPSNQNSARFNLKPFNPNELKWSSFIKKQYQYLLQNKHWYYFEITPNPSVVDAYAAVNFLEIIQQAKKTSKTVLLSYKLENTNDVNTCVLDFGKGDGVFRPLWEKLSHYQRLLATKKEKETAQNYLVSQCAPYGFPQIEQWANQKTTLTTTLEGSDLSIFLAVEQIKIITESIPDSIAAHLKRELRELLLSDITLLEMPTGNAKSQKLKQKMDLLKELSLYPELEPFLAQYNQVNGNAATLKQTEQEQLVEFNKIAALYQPYKLIFEKHQVLQEQLEAIRMQLLQF